MSPQLSYRIEILRTVSIAGLVVLHVPPHLSVPADGGIAEAGMLTYLKLLFDNVLFRSSLPTLSVLSGYLLFRSYRLERYTALLRKKFRSLGVPLLLWNIPLVLAVYLLDRYELLNYSFRVDLHPAGFFEFLDATIGLRDQPVNFPLQFLRELLLCAIVSPVLWLFLKRAPYIGLVFLFLGAFLLPLDGKFFARTEIALFVYLGGMWAVRGWSIEVIVDRHAGLWIGATAIGGLLIAWLAFDRLDGNEGIGPYVRFFRFVGILGFFALSGVLLRGALGSHLARCSRYAFWVFCTHGPILGFLWLLLRPSEGNIESVEYLLFYVTAPAMTLIAGVVSYELCRRFAPRLWSWLIGNRPEPVVPRVKAYSGPGA